MAAFEFTVNDSFLDGPGHPITIPKGQLPYARLTAAGLDLNDITVILPHGERFKAAIYHGEAGFGEYYQLRFSGSNRTLPSYLTLGEKLIIVLTQAVAHSYALVEFRG